MFRSLSRLAPLFAAAVVAAVDPAPAAAQQFREPGGQPRLRAALHELREARQELSAARDNFPPGQKERGLAAIQDAINSVKTILAIKDVDNFRGVDRNPDYYKRFRDHPRLRAALQDLRDARRELDDARAGVAPDLKERALDDIDVAVGAIVTLMRR